jgi:glycosidase
MNYVFNRAAQCFFGGGKVDADARPGGFALEPIKAKDFARRVQEMLGMYPWPVTQAQLNLLGSHDTGRILSILGGDRDSLKLCFLFQMTMPGAPCIYYGDEVGMTSAPVEGQEGRATMSWDETRWDLDLRETLKQYIALRKAHPVLRRGTFAALCAHNKKSVYAFARHLEDETAIVVLNNGRSGYDVHVPTPKGKLASGAQLVDLLGGATYTVQGDHIVGPQMPPRSGIVLRPL